MKELTKKQIVNMPSNANNLPALPPGSLGDPEYVVMALQYRPGRGTDLAEWEDAGFPQETEQQAINSHRLWNDGNQVGMVFDTKLVKRTTMILQEELPWDKCY